MSYRSNEKQRGLITARSVRGNFGADLYDLLVKGSIFESSDPNLKKVRNNAVKYFQKEYRKNIKQHRRPLMKRAIKEYALKYLKEVYYKKSFKGTFLENNPNFAIVFAKQVEIVMNNLDNSGVGYASALRRETLQNQILELKKKLDPIKEAFFDELEQRIEIAEECQEKAEPFLNFINECRDANEEKAWETAKKLRKKYYFILGKNKKAKRLFTEGEIVKMIKDKSKLEKFTKFGNSLNKCTSKMLKKLKKVKSIVNTGDFAAKFYELQNTKGGDNVQYFLDVKQLFNQGGDIIEGIFGEIDGIGDFITFYNQAFKATDILFTITAKHVRKIMKSLGVFDKFEKNVSKYNARLLKELRN
ncbi:hypothetical protein AAEX28_02125 [Lentisphaerota bacterium WC36G]|nr:hypothetical protein LJT99_05010 [Lentisphaerae bacterium WC36]